MKKQHSKKREIQSRYAQVTQRWEEMALHPTVTIMTTESTSLLSYQNKCDIGYKGSEDGGRGPPISD